MHIADGLPVSDVATPTLRVLCFCVAVNLLSMRQDVRVVAGVTLRWGDELNRAVQVLVVVPINEPAHPGARIMQAGKQPPRDIQADTSAYETTTLNMDCHCSLMDD